MSTLIKTICQGRAGAGAMVETKESQRHVKLCVSENIRDDLVNVSCLFHYFSVDSEAKTSHTQASLKGL